MAIFSLSCAGGHGTRVDDSQHSATTSTVQFGVSPSTTVSGSLTTAAAQFSLENQPTSRYPVGQEWREHVPLGPEFDNLWKLAYNEWQLRTAVCMKSRGFESTPLTYFDEKRVEYYRAINPLNVAAATTLAYHLPQMPGPPSQSTAQTAGYVEALDGTSDDETTGCAYISNKQVYRIASPLTDRYQLLVNDLDQRVYAYFASKEGAAAVAEWRACMAQRGYASADRDEYYATFSSSAEVSDSERQTRQADLECDVSTGLTAARSTWERKQFDEWLAATTTEWSELASDLKVAVQKLTDLAAAG